MLADDPNSFEVDSHLVGGDGAHPADVLSHDEVRFQILDCLGVNEIQRTPGHGRLRNRGLDATAVSVVQLQRGPRHDWQRRRLRRVVAFVGDRDHAAAESQREERFGGARKKRDDPHAYPPFKSNWAKPESRRRSPALHVSGFLKTGPANANEWYSPFSPHGSAPVVPISVAKRSSMTRPSHASSSFARSTQVTTALPPDRMNSPRRSCGGSPQIGSTCSSPAAVTRSSYQARTSTRWMSPKTTPVNPSSRSAASSCPRSASISGHVVAMARRPIPIAAACASSISTRVAWNRMRRVVES